MKKYIIILNMILLTVLLTGCGEESMVDEIKYDLSIEYDIPISDVEVKTIEHGNTIFSTNQFEVHIESKDINLYLIEKDGTGNNFRRIPIK